MATKTSKKTMKKTVKTTKGGKKATDKVVKSANNGVVKFTAAEMTALVAAAAALSKGKRAEKRVFASVARGLTAIVAYNS